MTKAERTLLIEMAWALQALLVSVNLRESGRPMIEAAAAVRDESPDRRQP